jgi:hypothetical protein
MIEVICIDTSKYEYSKCLQIYAKMSKKETAHNIFALNYLHFFQRNVIKVRRAVSQSDVVHVVGASVGDVSRVTAVPGARVKERRSDAHHPRSGAQPVHGPTQVPLSGKHNFCVFLLEMPFSDPCDCSIAQVFQQILCVYLQSAISFLSCF